MRIVWFSLLLVLYVAAVHKVLYFKWVGYFSISPVTIRMFDMSPETLVGEGDGYLEPCPHMKKMWY